jgi:hypothetical protein
VGARRARPVVLDAGALIAFERNERKVRTLIELAMARLLGSGLLDVQVPDRDEAQAVGVLCGRSGTSDAVDASVALLARRLPRAVVVTSDPDDLRRLDPLVNLVVC